MPDLSEKSAEYRHHVIDIIDSLSKARALNQHPFQAGRTWDGTEARYRQNYQQWRITDGDVSAAIRHHLAAQAGQQVCGLDQQVVTYQDIYRIALLYALPASGDSQVIRWHDGEPTSGATPPESFYHQLRNEVCGSVGAHSLWAGLSQKLELPTALLPTEAELTKGLLAENGNIHNTLRQLASDGLNRMQANLGSLYTLRGLVQALGGVDILEQVNPQLQHICASLLDMEKGEWSIDAHQGLGLYGLWRKLARQDASLFLHQLPDWQNIIAELPDDAATTVALQLQRFDIPIGQWEAYLQRLTSELPEWARPLPCNNALTPALTDFLAIRLTLDRLWLNQVCHDIWKIEAKTSSLQGYFRKNLSEFWVRLQLYQGLLPEYLTQQAEALIIRSGSERQCRTDWQQLADLILTRQRNLTEAQCQENNIWRLYRLCQHLGLNATHVQALDKTDLHAMLSVLDGFKTAEHQAVWLYAYENHVRQALLAALGQDPTASTSGWPKVHVVWGYDSGLKNTVATNGFTAINPPQPPHKANAFPRVRPSTYAFHQHPLLAYLWTFIHAPLALAYTLTRILFPGPPGQELPAIPKATIAPNDPLPHTADGSDVPVKAVANFLRAAGLTGQFADFVVLVGSDPAHTDPNGLDPKLNFQQIAAFANQPETRILLSLQGIVIPAGTRFIAAYYDRADATLGWHGLDEMAPRPDK